MMRSTRRVVLQTSRIAIIAWASVWPATVGAQDDVKGSKDHPLFNRMPGYFIISFDERDFDVYQEFRDAKGQRMSVEGKTYRALYQPKRGQEPATDAAIIRNFVDAARQAGGVILHQTRTDAYMRFDKNNARTWASVVVFGGGNQYQLRVIEEQALQQVIVANAAVLAAELGTAGRVALYGIYFDVDMAVVKPESEPALKEIAALMTQQPQLQLFVVGHTDNSGTLEHNMKLSQARAQAVVETLVRTHGIDRARLTAHGVGPLSPVAPNVTEDGRARNRRVELVVR